MTIHNARKRKAIWQIPLLILLIVGTVLIILQQKNMPYQHDEGFIFGTVYHVTYQSDDNLKSEIEAELKKVDDEFSMFNKLSSVTAFNQKGRLKMSPMFEEVYQMAADINRETNGSFDITVAPLVNAWGFGFKNQQMPTPQEVKEMRQHVGMNKLSVTSLNGYKATNELRKKDQAVMLDFSAIAKGYGSDRIARLLRLHDIKNFMVEIGGEIVTSGVSEKRLPWKIGITKPGDDSLSTNKELQTVLNVTDKAMATSGNYRNFYYKGGKKYAHTIDPQTGYPVQHSLLSATVIANRCAQADAYATSFMVMGIDKAKEVLKKHPELKAYFIYSDHKGNYSTWHSEGLTVTQKRE